MKLNNTQQTYIFWVMNFDEIDYSTKFRECDLQSFFMKAKEKASYCGFISIIKEAELGSELKLYLFNVQMNFTTRSYVYIPRQSVSLLNIGTYTTLQLEQHTSYN